ncbi:hypothetical protein [Shinella sumterensis]|uniref:ER-bound oxygenase mpaB/mpaB'/Rubber oxygenase catalytic domain-containing protein n=1 Tax=Shinella sumterensis TaxID=1967501 RepID=A0AA50CRE6_9HYPH|nr:hypothetical protein [Shinella sumterensis]WLS00674.1 hypothetical protein Q9313_25225 [Shinella sumterensis]
MNEAPKKWIRQEIESLDPETDYVRIWRLSSSYGLNEFMSGLSYVTTFQNFVVTDWGSEAIWRDDGGKVLKRPFGRVEQTEGANFIWWFYGPHDERTKKSVDAINRLHAYWAKKLPGRFSYNDDYVYVAAYTATSMHRFRLALGLPGFLEKEKFAAHKFWGEMTKLFVAENNTPLHGYPDDFDGLLAFCERYEHEPRPRVERVNLIVSAFHEQFVFRFFPKELHWLGHQLLRALSLPTTLETAQIDPPLPAAKQLLPKLLGFILSYQEEFADDPQSSYLESLEQLSPEQKVERRAEMVELDKAFGPYFKQIVHDDAKFSGCPFHEALKASTPATGTTSAGAVTEMERTSVPHAH